MGSSNGAAGGRAPPHRRPRDPAATMVYVVHPSQFRNVVQQLTGRSPPPPTTPHPAAAAATTTSTGASANTNAAAMAAQQHRGAGGGELEIMNRDPNTYSNRRPTTLRQMHQDCMAWAAGCHHHDDDDDY